MTLISLCLIVKNEAELLPRALGNLDDFWDELIVVDTGSDDDTVTIAESFGAKVLHYDWQYPGNKGAARNMGLEAATGEWVVVLDADEIIRQPVELRAWVATLPEDTTIVSVMFENYALSGHCSLRWWQPRIWRNGRYFYRHREHEMPFAVDDPGRTVGCMFVFEHRPPPQREQPKVQPMLDRLIADVADDPNDGHALYFLHRQWLHVGEWQKVIDTGYDFLNVDGPYNRFECYGNMATASWQLGDPDTALEWLHRALAYEPQRRYWWVRIAEIHVAERRYNTAMAYLRGGGEVWQQHQWQFEPGVEVQQWNDLTQVCQSALASMEGN